VVAGLPLYQHRGQERQHQEAAQGHGVEEVQGARGLQAGQDKHTWRQNLSLNVCITRSKVLSFSCSFSDFTIQN
jgi:hypothetical protein